MDNAGSLSHLINGCAGQPDSAKIVNVFHAALIALRMRWWGERISSKANIADIMTRPGRFHELLAGLKIGADDVQTYDFVLPPINWETTGLVEWMRLMRDRSERVTREHSA